MSEENVEIVRAGWETWMQGDVTQIEDMSFVDSEIVYEDDSLPDHVGETYRGHEGLRRAWARFTEPWGEFENHLEWVRGNGDAVVSFHRTQATGRESGVPVEFHYAYLWRFDQGKVTHLRSYAEPAEALEAAGLSE